MEVKDGIFAVTECHFYLALRPPCILNISCRVSTIQIIEHICKRTVIIILHILTSFYCFLFVIFFIYYYKHQFDFCNDIKHLWEYDIWEGTKFTPQFLELLFVSLQAEFLQHIHLLWMSQDVTMRFVINWNISLFWIQIRKTVFSQPIILLSCVQHQHYCCSIFPAIKLRS